MNLYTVSQVMKMTGATRPQLRNWHKLGVLRVRQAGENISNNRKLYTDEDVERVREILLLQETGLKLKEIREILNAPEEEKQIAIANAAARLKEQYTQLEKKLMLSSIARSAGLEQAKSAAHAFGSLEALEDSLAKNESLKAILRWEHSHTDRDISELQDDLARIIEEFEQLDASSGWETIEDWLARFCDIWGERFGWPSVGQMLTLHFAFQDEGSWQDLQNESLFDKTTRQAIANAFLLGWASDALACLDDLLAHLFMHSISPEEAADVLISLVCELAGQPHLHDMPESDERTQHIKRLSEDVFDLLESIALDDQLGPYLELDELPAIEGPNLELACDMALANADDGFKAWMPKGGAERIEHDAALWRDGIIAELGLQDADDADEKLSEWFKERYPDAPEARWETEEEACATEKRVRELIQS
ncbi:MAG: MerR family transcriptional regulator [Eggerthellaceae bacterium]|nr:MerR family transcriptional regulator [Eggerthellaceae bacterium]